ncbi:hypothetical protein MFRU_011g01320 [Monilinia fructicola]|nr:hypothetical protein MFRU_011g01320 [Monilinia fructicola]
MGIPELWQLFDKAAIGQNISIAAFAASHFERERRPLRIAIDVSIWKFKCYQDAQKVAAIRKKVPAANPNEKNILFKILKLLKLNMQLIFVADGKNRPAEKYGGQSCYKHRSQDDTLLKQTVTSLGVIWHEAPGEAEAECAALQSRGVVDYVWTVDSDAFVFGATSLIRFAHVEKDRAKKDAKKKYGVHEPDEIRREIDFDNIVVYRADRIQERFPGLTRDGLVLFAVLKGGDYSKNGKSLTNCGPVLALEIATAKEGFGEELCNSSVADFPAWANRLRGYLEKTNSRVNVPHNFPDPRIVSLYNKPLVSSERVTSDIDKFWDASFDEMELQKVVAPKFNFWVAEYIKHVIPILLIRSLACTKPGQEASNNCYKLQVVGKPKEARLQKSVDVLLSAVTTMNIPTWRRDFTFNRGGKITQVTEMVRCEDLLSCIIDHGTKKALPSAIAPSKNVELSVVPEIHRGRKRAGSPMVPSTIFRFPQEQALSKRVKGTLEQSSGPRPVSMEPALPQSEVSYQTRNTFPSTKETPLRSVPQLGRNRMTVETYRETRPSKSHGQGIANSSSGLTIDLTLDDSSDEENQTSVTISQTHNTSTSIFSKDPQNNALREARHQHFSTGKFELTATLSSQEYSHSVSKILHKDSQLTPLAKKPLPQGINEDDFDGFFSDSSI